MKKAITSILLSLICISGFSQEKGTYTDTRDGKAYKTVKIGDQTWFAENLAFQEVGGNCWAYYDKATNTSKYGNLYDWQTALIVCPVGWHLPSKNDFEILLKNVGNEGNNAYASLILDGKSGFSSILCGYRKDYGAYSGLKENSDFWSCTEYEKDYAWHLDILKKNKSVELFNNYKQLGMSVRCIKD
jgi:uncharacterized protein (TIGR02145 family)